MDSESVAFSAIVRAVAGEARLMGLRVPGYRSPPGVAGVDRTIRRSGTGLIVAVRVRGRPPGDVAADVIEAVLVANRVPRDSATHVRRRLVDAVVSQRRPAA